MHELQDRVKAKVAEELGRVNRFVGTLMTEMHPTDTQGAGDNTPLSETADAAQVVEDREVRSQLLDYLVERAIELDRALRRIDAGTYGVCARCEEYIHPERLRAMPGATLCIQCQSSAEAETPVVKPTRFQWLELARRESERAETD
jgi:RNA polymerase-binding transcription factor DksA